MQKCRAGLRGQTPVLCSVYRMPYAVYRLSLLLSAFCLLASCGPPRSERIVVGSKNFTEQLVLGELVAQEIEARTRLPVERRFYLAGSYICHQAILAGRIDVYVEYTGTALTAILKEPAGGSAAEIYAKVKEAYAQRFHLDVTDPLGFNNTFAIVVRGEDARRLQLRTISDAARYTPQWRAGFGYEFMERPDGYRGLAKTYGLRFAAPPRIMDLGLLYRSLLEKQVDLVAGNSTDGLLAARDLTALDDDRHYFPPYQAVPIVRQGTIRRHPEVLAALEALAGKITDEDMRRMNYAVDGQHRDAKQVVREFLKSNGLLNPIPDH
ncbi:MAG TPA: glycine betaine ABC transporter substrate-binding protein [Terriglobia bacterium]|nr:glycine betaine ABC transporter substrate-binding protein [Terriglobia bacterium]